MKKLREICYDVYKIYILPVISVRKEIHHIVWYIGTTHNLSASIHESILGIVAGIRR